MVDELIAWPQKAKPGAERHFGEGKPSCHLTCDGDEEELHLFAESIGIERRWAQRSGTPKVHYDLGPMMRELALASGAVFVPGREQARQRRARQV